MEKLCRETVENYEESERLRKEMETSMQNITNRVDEYISKAKSELEVDRFQVLNDTKAQAEQIIQQARENARLAQIRATEEFHGKMMDTIMDIVKQVLSKSLPEGFQDQLIQQITDRVWELGRKEMRQVETVRKSLAGREPVVTVKTPDTLTKEQQANIIRTFSALADTNVKLEVERDESLIGGIRIRLGDFIVDNSFGAKLDEIRAETIEALNHRMKELQNQ